MKGIIATVYSYFQRERERGGGEWRETDRQTVRERLTHTHTYRQSDREGQRGTESDREPDRQYAIAMKIIMCSINQTKISKIVLIL